jgi:Flp pilus assembly protein TadD
MPLSLVRLAALHRDNGNLGAAVEALRKALELTPEDPDTLALMGAYLSEAGRAQEAVDLLEAHTERSEPALDVLTARGMALAHLGRFAEALQTFAAAQELDPSNAMALVNVATVYLMAQDLPRARGALERALAMNPGLARAHNSLGVIAARSGRPEEAIDHWRRAVEIEPREFDTLFNLGMLLLRRGRPAEARAYLERFVQSAPAAAYAQDIARIRDWLRGGHTLQPAPSP